MLAEEASVLASVLPGHILRRSACLIFRALMEPTVFCLGLITLSMFIGKLDGGLESPSPLRTNVGAHRIPSCRRQSLQEG